MIITKLDAILSLLPDAKVTITGDEIEWIGEQYPLLSNSQIDAEIIRLQDVYDAEQYKRNRLKEYPSIEDQLDLLYHDKVNGTNKWVEALTVVKDKYPKPEE